MEFSPAVASISLGHPTVHGIGQRLEAAAKAGFKLVELTDADLDEHAKTLEGGPTESNRIEAAKFVRGVCDRCALEPFVLQPFWLYDGLLDREEHAARIEKLHLWMKLVKILGVTLVQTPTNWLVEGTTGDLEVIVQDMREMADIGLAQDPVVRFAYEAAAWGTHIDTWQGTWEVVKQVDRPNFGLCLDTFHIAARAWGDPTAVDGKLPDADDQLRRSIQELVQEVDVAKIFYLQLGDVERLSSPLVAGHPFHSDSQPPRMSWSRNARLFAFEQDRGGHLPVEPIANAILNTLHYRGYVSMEIFSRHLFDPNPDIPAQYAARGMASWNKMLKMLED